MKQFNVFSGLGKKLYFMLDGNNKSGPRHDLRLHAGTGFEKDRSLLAIYRR